MYKKKHILGSNIKKRRDNLPIREAVYSYSSRVFCAAALGLSFLAAWTFLSAHLETDIHFKTGWWADVTVHNWNHVSTPTVNNLFRLLIMHAYCSSLFPHTALWIKMARITWSHPPGLVPCDCTRTRFLGKLSPSSWSKVLWNASAVA